MNKRQRKAREKRTSSGYQAAQEKRERLFLEALVRQAQEFADEVLRQQYSIVG